MNTQVFISYSSQDRVVAEAIHDALEQEGIPAWLAHRDLTGGVPWSQRIIDEIHAARVMILILSQHANESPYVIREVAEAVERHAAILTVRIEDVAPSKGLKFFIAAEQWLDVFGMSAERYHKRVIDDVRLLLGSEAPAPAPAPQPPLLPVAQPEQPRLRAQLQRHPALVRGTLAFGAVAAVVAAATAVPALLQPDVVLGRPSGDVFVGDTLRLAMPGKAIEHVVWSSSNQQVFRVLPIPAAFQAVGTGTAVLRGKRGRKQDSVAVTVRAARAATLSILPEASSLRVGDSAQFSARARDAAGREIAAAEVAWRSLTPGIATITETGLVRALAAGRARIAARVDSVSETVDVNVVARGTKPPTAVVRKPIVPLPIVTRAVGAELPTEGDLARLADLCLDALKRRDVNWIEQNYHPPTPEDQNYLSRLRTVMRQDRYTVKASGIGSATPASRAIEFWAEFGYRSSFGANLSARGTFRVLATEQAGSWRLASCRTIGALTGKT